MSAFEGFVFGSRIPDAPGFYFGGGGPAFSPLDLDPLAFYDPSDASSLFQNEGGTIPAGVGDPVRRMLDLSGNDNHITAPSGAARPVLQSSGSLLTDGVDDMMGVSLSVGAARSIYAAGRIVSTGYGAFILSTSFPMALRYDRVGGRVESEPDFWKPFGNGTLGLNEWFVLAIRMDGDTEYLDQFTAANGALSASQAYASSAGPDRGLSIGARYSNTEHMSVEYASVSVFDGFIGGSDHEAMMNHLKERLGL